MYKQSACCSNRPGTLVVNYVKLHLTSFIVQDNQNFKNNQMNLFKLTWPDFDLECPIIRLEPLMSP